MDWVKLSTGYYTDRKVRRLPDADTEVMFVRSLAYAGGEETCGFIPEDDVPLLSRRRRYDSCVDALLEAGLWMREEGGYRLPPDAWDRWNGDLDVLARRRAADRERKRRVRSAAVSADTSADGPRTVHPTKKRGEGEVKGGNPREVPHAARDSPPPRRCPKHTDTTDPPDCGACKERRLAAERWDRHQAAAVTAANHQAAAARRTTPRCSRCGRRHTPTCTA